MKIRQKLLRASALMVFGVPAALTAGPRERLSLDADWLFIRGDPPEVQGSLAYGAIKERILQTRDAYLHPLSTVAAPMKDELDGVVSYTRADFDDRGWRRLDLPHDWAIELPFDRNLSADTARLPFWGIGWYRKHLDIPASDRGRRIVLAVDGAMSYATVWLNGRFVGGWPYGYASFELDLTSFLVPGGPNLLAIRLENPKDSSRWYPGSGIYRNVWLVKTNPVHVAQWGTCITTPAVSGTEATVQVTTTLSNESEADTSLKVQTALYLASVDGRPVGDRVGFAEASAAVASGGRQVTEQSIRLPDPVRWSLAHPQRYVAVTTLDRDGQVLDQYDTPFGIRSLTFDPERGFFLNGEQVKFNGVCDHQDLGCLGTAFNQDAMERQLRILQEMGCNAIRTSHNPPPPELLDLCDRMGFLVMDESFDCWREAKRPNDYHLLFDDWHEADLRAEIRRDRNHPSVIIWSVGNEVPEQKVPAGREIAAALVKIVHEEDPTRPASAACDKVEAGFNGMADALDIFGYNYKPGQYARFHAAHPGKFLFGSETTATFSSRGEYAFPFTTTKSEGRMTDVLQVSSYDLYANPHATPPDIEFAAQDADPYVGGEFVWTGRDYLGESTPYDHSANTSRSTYLGIVDLAGFKKDRFYLYQAHWRPDLPMAHLLPHWNWPERMGQITPVQVYTSGDEAELFLNGLSLGRKKMGPGEYRFRWDEVRYQSGELRVETYKKGRPWAEDIVRTTGPAARLLLDSGSAVLGSGAADLAFLTITVADRDGLMVPRSHNHVRVSIAGPGEVVAMDNGDAASFAPFQAAERDVFNGLALAIIRAKPGATGPIIVTVRADGLSDASFTFHSSSASHG